MVLARHIFGIILAVVGTRAIALEGPGSQAPLGPATVPASAMPGEQEPVSSTGPSATGNDVVTGHVAGGRHFRGTVPYGGPADFRGSLGSTYLDPFFRYSQPRAYEFGPGTLSPFYSQTRTTTQVLSGTGYSILMPMTPVPWGESSSREPSEVTWQDGPRMEAVGLPLRPMARTPYEIEQRISFDLADPSEGMATSDTGVAASGQDGGQTEEGQGWTGPRTPISGPDPAVADDPIGQWIRALKAARSQDTIRTPEVNGVSTPGAQGARRSLGADEIDPNAASPSMRGRPLDPGQTLDSVAEARYASSMKAAEAYLVEGKPYQAVDAYALALMCRPGDPLALAGRGQALFVCGEYSSSALFLRRAIKAAPGCAYAKVDWTQLAGPVLARCTEELRSYASSSNSADLHFLLGYVRYHLGQLDEARQSIRKAQAAGSSDRAVEAVSKAIEDALTRQGT